jgi:hypothetical protein
VLDAGSWPWKTSIIYFLHRQTLIIAFAGANLGIPCWIRKEIDPLSVSDASIDARIAAEDDSPVRDKTSNLPPGLFILETSPH